MWKIFMNLNQTKIFLDDEAFWAVMFNNYC